MRILGVVLALTAAGLFADEGNCSQTMGDMEVRSIKARRVDAAPTIDGKLTEECWQGPALEDEHVATGFRTPDGPSETGDSPSARLAYDDDAVYVAFRCPLAGPEAAEEARDLDPAEMSGRHSMEVFLDPFLHHRREAGMTDDLDRLFYTHLGPKVFRFAVNAANGRQSDLMGTPWWRVPWRSATHIGEDYWSAELAIPLASLAFFEQSQKSGLEPAWGSEWGVNFAHDGAVWVPGDMASAYPLSYGAVTHIDADPSDYRWATLHAIGPKLVGPLTIALTLTNHTGERRAVKAIARTVMLDGMAPDSPPAAEADYDVQTEGEGIHWDHGALEVPLEAPGDHVVLLSVVDPETGRALTHRPVLVDDVALGFGSWDRSIYMDEREARLTVQLPADVESGVVVRCDLRGSDATAILQSRSAPTGEGSRARVVFDLQSLGVGDYAVTTTVSGYEEDPFVTDLRKLPARPGAVQYTDRGVLLRDGVPFFPFGMYYITLHLKGEMLEEYSSAGFNTYVMEWMNAQGYADMARRVEEYGLVPIVGIQNMAGSHAYDSSGDYSQRGMLDGRFEVGRMGVSTVSRDAGHNVLAYYTRDEPNELMYDLLKGLHEIVREVDPYHPSMTVIYTPHLFPAYHSATDVLGPDIYPSFPGGRIARVGESMAKAHEEMLGKPVLAVLQSFYDGDRRMPNRAELRCMTYLSIVNGVTGILYFSYDYNGSMKEKHPEAWEALKELAGEARTLAPVFLSEPPSDLTLEMTGSDDVDAKVFRHDGTVYVVAVNREDRAPSSVAFALGGETGVCGDLGPVDVLFEGRRVATEGNVWTDHFGAYDVHVYKLCQ